jgi:uncharacterized protein (DUF58 family)
VVGLIDPSFLDELRELDFVISKKVSSVFAGGRPSVKHGRGIEVIDYREYIPGDDFRLIDWKVYARSEKLYIRRFEEEKELTIHLLVDSSLSMGFKTGRLSKFDYAGSIAAGFGYISVNNHEKFALALFSSAIREITQPRKSQNHLFNVMQLLNTVELKGSTNLGVCASQYTKLIKTKSFTIIISDFLEELDTVKEGIYRLAKQSKEMMLIQVLDPWELELGWKDDVKFQDMETGEVKRTYLSPGFKRDYTRSITEHNSKIQSICHDLGVEFVSVTTDTPLFDSFVKIVGGGRRGG